MNRPNLLSPEFIANPYPFHRTIRDQFPLFFHEPTNSYVLSRYADVARLLKDPVFSTRNYEWQAEPFHGRTIIQMDGKEHTTHRNIVTPAIRGRDLKEKMLPVVRRNAKALINGFLWDGKVEFVSQFTAYYPIGILVDMLALPRRHLPKFERWYASLMAVGTNLAQDPEVTAAGLRTREELSAYILPIIRERRENPGDDLLSTLCTAEIDGVRMSDAEINSFCSLLLTAGGETTHKVIASLLKNLMEHPEQMEQVREDRSLVDRAIVETMRYSPTIHMIMRLTTADVELEHGTIPANSLVLGLIGAAQRDERHFKEPETFNIFRDELNMEHAFTGAANHLAFGGGRHFCIGSLLARMEANVALNAILDHMQGLRFQPGFIPREVGLFLRYPRELHVEFTPVPELALAMV